MPTAPLPAGVTETEHLIQLTGQGMKELLGGSVPREYMERAEYELNVIKQMGFSGYFLVVRDIVIWAKKNGILVGLGRGSAGGSLVAWAIGITGIDPIKHGLLFERFLNPERVSPPDIDIDFQDDRRGEVISYAITQYGADKVAQIATINRLKAKAAIKDVARALELDYTASNQLTSKYPEAIAGFMPSLAEVYDPKHERYEDGAEFRAYVEANDLAYVVDEAKRVEGFARNNGLHAAAVLISKEPLVKHIPLIRRAKGNADDRLVAGFEYPICEELGALKVDVLGVKVLTVAADTIAMAKERFDTVPTVNEMVASLNDSATYRTLASGHTTGVFQLESSGMQTLLQSVKPDRFDDVSAVLALYRPGPMGANAHIEYADRKNGRRQITYIHPEFSESLKDILGPTYGLIVYQEQVMAIAQEVAGYSLGQADILRRAMGKKKKEILDKEFVPFSRGAKERGYSDAAIKTLWDTLVPFASYSFNQAHTVGYGLLSYATAYLKTHYPAEFMAAMLNAHSTSKTKIPVLLAECARLGVRVLPPDVNVSRSGYTVNKDGAIVTGFSSIKGIGDGVAVKLEAERANGSFGGVLDFLHRVPANGANKNVVRALAETGGFDSIKVALEHADAQLASFGVWASTAARASDVVKDFLMRGDFLSSEDAHSRVGSLIEPRPEGKSMVSSFGFNRASIIANLDALLDTRKNATQGNNPLGDDLFGSDAYTDSFTRVPEFSFEEKLELERGLLGRSVSGHLIDRYQEIVASLGLEPIASVVAESAGDDSEDGEGEEGGESVACERVVDIVGIVSSPETKKSRRGSLYVSFTLEDAHSGIGVFVFSPLAGKHRAALKRGALVRVQGVIKPGESKVLASNIVFPEAIEAARAVSSSAPVSLRLKKSSWLANKDDILDVLSDIIDTHPGKRQVSLLLIDELGDTSTVSLPSEVGVDANESFVTAVREKLAPYRP